MRTASSRLSDLRRIYPNGKRITMLFGHGPQAPETGTKGTVLWVDAQGQVMVAWNTGSCATFDPKRDTVVNA